MKNIHLKRQCGFTLIEMIMVLVIMGILSTLALPRLDSISSFDQKGFKDQLKASLEFARNTAVARRRYVCVALSQNSGSAFFSLNTTPPESLGSPVNCQVDLNLPTPSAGCAANAVCAGGDVSFNITGASQFLFNPLGQAVDSNKVLLTNSPAITLSLGEQSIQIDATGLVR